MRKIKKGVQMNFYATLFLLLSLLMPQWGAWGKISGVSKNEVLIGTHTDLSGPAAIWGVHSVNGMNLYFAKINKKGGIHGRKIRLLVQDHQYQVPKAIQGVNKLILRDGIFAMIGALGTPMNNAVMSKLMAKNIPNLFPYSGARSMVAPWHRLKFLALPTYYDQVRIGVKYFKEKMHKKSFCLMAQSSDYGQEVEEALRAQLKVMGLKLKAKTTHRPGDNEFVGAITKLKKAKCDLVVLGTIIKDTIISVATAKKLGLKASFLATFASYDQIVAAAKSGITQGLYAMAPMETIYEDTATGKIKAFYTSYKKVYGTAPNAAAQIGYFYAQLFVQALKNAGPDLTLDSFIQGLEKIKNFSNMFGGPKISFGPKKHKAFDSSLLVQVKKGRWVRITQALSL